MAGAQELPDRLLYHEGFEADEDPVRFWVTNGEYQINFNGITDERAFEGTRPSKLDVTLPRKLLLLALSGACNPEGDLRFSARIYVAEGNTAHAASA